MHAVVRHANATAMPTPMVALCTTMHSSTLLAHTMRQHATQCDTTLDTNANANANAFDIRMSNVDSQSPSNHPEPAAPTAPPAAHTTPTHQIPHANPPTHHTGHHSATQRHTRAATHPGHRGGTPRSRTGGPRRPAARRRGPPRSSPGGDIFDARCACPGRSARPPRHRTGRL